MYANALLVRLPGDLNWSWVINATLADAELIVVFILILQTQSRENRSRWSQAEDWPASSLHWCLVTRITRSTPYKFFFQEKKKFALKPSQRCSGYGRYFATWIGFIKTQDSPHPQRRDRRGLNSPPHQTLKTQSTPQTTLRTQRIDNAVHIHNAVHIYNVVHNASRSCAKRSVHATFPADTTAFHATYQIRCRHDAV